MLLKMIILNPELLNLFKFFINSAYFFRVIPFKWCRETNRVYRNVPYPWNIYKWDVVKYIILFHQLFLIIRLWQSLNELSIQGLLIMENLASHIPDMIYIGTLLMCCFCELTFIHKSEDIQVQINQFLNFAKLFEGKLTYQII